MKNLGLKRSISFISGLILFMSLALLPRSAKNSASAAAITFTDVTKAAGINFINFSSPDKKYIVESMGGGVALFDFNNDGLLDIYILNSYTVEAALANRPRPQASLYRNRGDGTFEDVAA